MTAAASRVIRMADLVGFLRAQLADLEAAGWHADDCTSIPGPSGSCCEARAVLGRHAETMRQRIGRYQDAVRMQRPGKSDEWRDGAMTALWIEVRADAAIWPRHAGYLAEWKDPAARRRLDQKVMTGCSSRGFPGSGITGTPGSDHRPLAGARQARGHQVAFLQAGRDRLVAGDAVSQACAFDSGMPGTGVLVPGWRWPIAGRNTAPCGARSRSRDLHRQAALPGRYLAERRTPTAIRDGSDRPARASTGTMGHPARLRRAAIRRGHRAVPLLAPGRSQVPAGE